MNEKDSLHVPQRPSTPGWSWVQWYSQYGTASKSTTAARSVRCGNKQDSALNTVGSTILYVVGESNQNRIQAQS